MKKQSVVFVIFGASGDLAKRKIIPAIYNLSKKNTFNFHVIGISRKSLSSRNLIFSSKKFIKNPKDSVMNSLIKKTSYLSIDFNKDEDYIKLFNELKKFKLCRKIFHLAVSSAFFSKISKNIFKLKLARKQDSLAFEKPFGHNFLSSKKLNNSVSKNFKENQIYRIDHYLGKELVENISLVRFTNRIFEPLWNKNHIESVEIILDENLGVGKRSYYDSYGAIKDMIQSHGLQLLSLIAMETPKKLQGDFIRDKKAEVLKNVKINNVLRAQYENYKKEQGKKSFTETFAVLKAEIKNKRWQGVPFFIRTGKNLEKKQSLIVIKFKKVKCLLSKTCPIDSNYLIIRIHPNEGISFEINTKVPQKNNVITSNIDFCHSCLFGLNTPDAYENLYNDILNKDSSVFLRNDEIEYSWKIIDKIKKTPLHYYKKGEMPKQLNIFSKENKVKWKF
jgi:glucose-6-phosphate 1-dehydrogenase